MTDEADRQALGARLVERAYLTGDFLLRSGRRSPYYLDKYRFETDPVLLDGLGRLIAEMLPAHAPEAELLAGPELGAVPLAALASVHTGLPFVIVRKKPKTTEQPSESKACLSPDSGCAWSRTWSPRAARCSTRWPGCGRPGWTFPLQFA